MTISLRIAGCIEQLEIISQFAQIVPPTEMIILVTVELSVCESAAMLNLCIPYVTIKSVIPKLSARHFYSIVHRGASDHLGTAAQFAADSQVEMRLCLDAGAMSLAKLSALQPREMILLEGWDRGEAFLCADGRAPSPEHRFMGSSGRSPGGVSGTPLSTFRLCQLI